MKKLARIASLAVTLSIAAVIGSGVAQADTGSRAYDHVAVGAVNSGVSPSVAVRVNDTNPWGS
ncbi:hypothetical protein [Streptacidiphilus sp. MAP5-3]|uniref:hypothetical protein n=1 Tax=unclassified Streptacidiphilus TaxID=2643834 RepID=UPI0035132DEB